MTEKKSLTFGQGFLAVAGVIGAAYLANRCTSGDKPEPQLADTPVAPMEAPKAEPKNEPAPPSSPSCVLSRSDGDGDVPVLPTEEGYDEFSKVLARETDGNARNIVFRANGGFWVDKGTKCLALDTGLLSSNVRVLEGPHAGKSGWVPNEWRLGK